MTLLVFLGGSSLLEGVVIISACPQVLNYFKAYVFQVDLLIVITSITFLSYQVLYFAGTSSSMKFAYWFAFPSSFRYFTRLFLASTWEFRCIVFDVGLDLADVERIVDKSKSTVR